MELGTARGISVRMTGKPIVLQAWSQAKANRGAYDLQKSHVKRSPSKVELWKKTECKEVTHEQEDQDSVFNRIVSAHSSVKGGMVNKVQRRHREGERHISVGV